MTYKFASWLTTNYAHPEIAYCIPNYIKIRGIQNLGEFSTLSREIQVIADSQDFIPWTIFMEGEISREIMLLQEPVLATSPSLLSIKDWVKQLITHILQILHAQWVFRIFSLHDRTVGYFQNIFCLGIFHSMTAR